MIDIERMYKYMDLLEGKRFVKASEFMTVMEISHATLKRDLAILRERFDVPIVYDRDIGAYRLDQNCTRMRLPGIWFSPEEIKTIRAICDELSIRASTGIHEGYRKLESKFSRISSSKY
jgi:predicted DNA-binding transcriptional regulator YafY